jgi:RNA polymerase sigma factor (sigma-70 family)
MVDTDDLTSLEYFSLKARRYRLLTSEEERVLSDRVRAGADAQRRLSAGEKGGTLWQCVKDGGAARNRLVEANLRLVLKHARRFAGAGVDLLDLVQEGNLALLRAAEKFDGRKGFRFSTYADSWIAAYIAIAAAETGTSIRIPKKVYSNIDKVRTATDRLSNLRKGYPTVENIAEESGLTPREVTQAQALVRVTSLDAHLARQSVPSLRDLVADPWAVDPSEHVVKVEDQRLVRKLMEQLPELEKLVIVLVYGLGDTEPQTTTQVAERLGFRRAEVSETKRAAVQRLRSVGCAHRQQVLASSSF